MSIFGPKSTLLSTESSGSTALFELLFLKSVSLLVILSVESSYLIYSGKYRKSVFCESRPLPQVALTL
jgi:hypothetical protein